MNSNNIADLIKEFNDIRLINVEKLAESKQHLQTTLGEVRMAELELAQLDVPGTLETNDVGQSNIRWKRAILSEKQARLKVEVFDINIYKQQIALLTFAINEIEMNPMESIMIKMLKNFRTLAQNQAIIFRRLMKKVQECNREVEIARRGYHDAILRNTQRQQIVHARAIVESYAPQPNLIQIALRDYLGRRIADSDGRVLWKHMVVVDSNGEPILNRNGQFVLLHGQNFNYLEPMSNGEMIAIQNKMQGKKKRTSKVKTSKVKSKSKC